jgi:hypothetical protein
MFIGIPAFAIVATILGHGAKPKGTAHTGMAGSTAPDATEGEQGGNEIATNRHFRLTSAQNISDR